ncbi:hypothetical protein L249_7160 [Ophiocordyceps polyrhachis-furcata BCC 54312]|uniref:TRUD domain-containing protein n=1 Tax=Ophiocordyceps polyrhachis-furcata BCC 54312 TaxID=1330021 RepID=A0A367LAY6_9HYPO|nr:hypothetical protein L249_7160 [Ophiocordyceps polyrhachis-furcata BCC 54312]
MTQVPGHVMRGGASHSRSIGITNRATPLTLAWTGDQRARYSDFQVNEIAQDGHVVHLLQVGLSDEQKRKQGAQQALDQTADTDGKPPVGIEAAKDLSTEVAAEDVSLLSTLGGQIFADDVVRLSKGGDDATDQVKSEAISDKFKRGRIHGEIRRIFKSAIETSTEDSGAIIAYRASSRKGKRRNRGARGQGRDKPSGEYLHFTLYKDNRDTLDAVNQIARMLRVKPQLIGYAGTKDKRASTTQRCSLRHANQRALAGANGKLWGMATGDYDYRNEPIHLGDLLGNEFVITIKSCRLVVVDNDKNSVDDAQTPLSTEKLKALLQEHAQSALDHMATHGWINYYGHQRFGTHRIGTHEVGKLILGEKWEDAVNALLYYDEEVAPGSTAPNDDDTSSQQQQQQQQRREDYARHRACMLFRTGADIEEAARLMPPRFAAETCLLRHLTRQGKASAKDYGGALTHITRGLRSMYLHAYQSYVWNHAASRRWELFGSSVVEGDLVLIDEALNKEDEEEDQDNDDLLLDPTTASTSSTTTTTTTVTARPLTAEEALSNRYSIQDVVLPSPGYAVTYPSNALGTFYQDFMARDGLDPHKMRRLRREFSLPGHYRKLVCRFLAPPAVHFRLYHDDAEQMHPTDVHLAPRPPKRVATAADADAADDDDDDDDDNDRDKKRRKLDADPATTKLVAAATDPDHDTASNRAMADAKAATDPAPQSDNPSKIAAILRMQLAKSAYATVAVRELMGDLPETVPTVDVVGK